MFPSHFLSAEVLQGAVQQGEGQIQLQQHEDAARGGARHGGPQEPERCKYTQLMLTTNGVPRLSVLVFIHQLERFCFCCSQVSYRKGKEQLHHYNSAPDRPDILNATNAAKLASDVSNAPPSVSGFHDNGPVHQLVCEQNS